MPKVKVRTPGGRIVIRRKKKRHKYAKCAGCGKRLHGVPTGPQVKIRKLAKSKKRPSRPYGGYYCSSCMRELFREKARKI